jgi:hypothetical protein
MAIEPVKYAVRKLMPKNKQSQAAVELWPEIDRRLQAGLQTRKPFEWQWILNMAFIFGKQYSVMDSSTSRLVEISLNPHEIRSTDNQMLPNWRRQVTDFVKSRPEFVAVPVSQSEEDREAANLATKVAKAFWVNRRVRKRLREAAIWLYAAGNVFPGDWWNARLDPIGFNPQSGRFEYAGDVDLAIWSPFDFVGPVGEFGIAEVDDLPWVILQKTRPIEYFVEQYGSRLGGMVRPEDDQGINVLTMVTNALGKQNLNEADTAREVMLKVKPCEAYPKGCQLIGANGIVLHKDDYKFGTYALEHWRDVEVPGIFYGKATSEFAIPLQRDWNRDTSSIQNFNVWMGKGKMMAPRSSNMEVEPDDTHGQVITYTPVMGHKPEHLTLKGLPTSYEMNLVRIKASLQDLYSRHEVSRGTNKSDLRSGDMVELLLEQDALGGYLPRATFEESLEVLMTRVLKRIAQGYKTERLREYGNSQDEMEILSFQGKDLGNNTTIKVVAQSSMPETRFAREMRIERRFKEGFYGDPMDPKVRRHVNKMLEDAVIEDVFSDNYLDEKLADWENKQISKGQPLVANDYDNHQIHLEVHARFLKQVKFQEAKLANPQLMRLEAMFGKHMQVHQNFVNEMIKAQMQMMGGNRGNSSSKETR